MDDLNAPRPLPTFGEAQQLAGQMNPDIRVATESLRQAGLDVKGAKTAFLPSIDLAVDYGTEANCLALHCISASFPEAGEMPNLG